MPWLVTEEGKPIETRPTEKPDNVPAFPEQTRAPYRETAPYKVTTLIDNLEVAWSLAFLPSGNIILTERLPGRLRILHTNGTVSAPLTGVSVVAVSRRQRHRTARHRSRPRLRQEPDGLLQLLQLHRRHEHQHVYRAGAARRKEPEGDRCPGHLPRAAGHAVETARRENRRPHRVRSGRAIC